MDIQIIGFLVALFLLGLSWLKERRDRADRAQNPEKYAEREKQQEEALRRFLGALDIEVEDLEPKTPPKPPPPPKISAPKQLTMLEETQKRRARKPSGDYEFKSRIEDRKHESRIEEKELQSRIEKRSGDNLVHIAPRTAGQGESYARSDHGAFDRKDISSYERSNHEAYALPYQKRPSRVKGELRQLRSLKTLVVVDEIIQPPKALR